MHENPKRNSIKVLMLGAVGVTAWHKPIINSVVLPAHAQTSVVVSNIVASSLDGDNPFSRFVLIVDSADNVLANCGASGGVASANNLGAGTYRIFADSNGAQTQIIDVSAGGNTQRVTVNTVTGACNFLVATIELPAGTISPATGEQQAASWSCSTNLDAGCN